MSTSSKMKAVADMTREERAHRTFQRIVYTKLCELQAAIYEARNHDTPLGVIEELDTPHLIGEIRRIGAIEYKSAMESKDYVKRELPSVESVKDLPILDVNEDVDF